MTTKKAQQIIEELLDIAGISLNGNRPWDIQVHNPDFYSRVLSHEALGLGESYMDGWWDCESVDEFISRVVSADLENKVRGNWRLAWHLLRSRLFNLQNRRRSLQVAREHYDLGNDLYQAMLDKRLNYTCAYWRNATDLDSAQEAKLELVCRKLELEKGMTVLELGCGYGAFARYAAEKYGVSVIGYNISEQQVKLGRELCQGLPVELRLEDYRNASGQYDRVVSIGIMEHVGYKNYADYMALTDRCLKPEGIAFFHTIGSNRSNTTSNAWTSKYIFPNGMLPSVAQLAAALEDYFVMEDWHNFGPDYDRTLMAWYANFRAAWPELKDRYGDRFYRMWEYYLLSCAGGFRGRGTQLWQVVMTKPGRRQPNCRLA